MSKCAVVWRIRTADSNQANSLAGTPQSVPKPIKLAGPAISSPGDGGLLISGGPEHLALRVCGRDHRGVSLPGGRHDPGGAGRSGLPSLSHSASCGQSVRCLLQERQDHRQLVEGAASRQGAGRGARAL